MLGAIIGDMVGSIYEFDPIKSKDFDIFDKRMFMTDDSLLTLAVAKVLMDNYPIDFSVKSLKMIQKQLIKQFALTWKNNPDAGWGNSFNYWCQKAYVKGFAEPYNSYGNGAAMRISPVAWLSKTEDELKKLSNAITGITHNHPEGLKGAEAVALFIFLALHGSSKEQIKERMVKEYYPEIAKMEFDDLVRNYEFSEICQESVPQAIYCFLISDSLEDAIRNCVAIGGDSDTTGAMSGAIAEAYYKTNHYSPIEKYYLETRIPKDCKVLIQRFHKMVGDGRDETYHNQNNDLKE